MEEIYRAEIKAQFIDIAQDLQDYINKASQIEPDITLRLKREGNHFEVHSYARNLWAEEVDYGAVDVEPPTYLGSLGVLEKINQKDSSSRFTEIRILSRTPSPFWQNFVFDLTSKYLIGDDDVKKEFARADEPWLRIPDHRWDREAVKLWCEGHTTREIAQRLKKDNKANVSADRVRNRLSELRCSGYSAEVPKDRERRRKIIEQSKL
jgi:hypothetical protein